MQNNHEVLKQFIGGLSKGYNNSLIVLGSAGIGKSETTMRALSALGYKEGINYIYLNNYITPVELYNKLQLANKLQEPKLVIMDDSEETLKNYKAVGLLKGALWAVDGKRKVSWVSGTSKIKVQEFVFNGRIIFLLNEMNSKSSLVKALQDRSLFFEIKFSKDELCQMIRERAKQNYQGIDFNKRLEIANYLIKVAGNSDKLSLRLLPKAFQLWQVSRNHWTELVDHII